MGDSLSQKRTMEITEEVIHKELHKEIWNCKKCCPVGVNDKYCQDCQDKVIDFMNKYGAGILTRDKTLEDLKENINKLDLINQALTNKLKEKVEIIKNLKSE